ncbi:MAG: hypothetical protein HW388_1274 [Dehalococcoidia bacterium]|nr:hypothetical protein [Dehalococcoidia bacterium]
MSVSRKKALQYAERLLEVPSAHLRVTLRRGKGGVTLLHRGKAVTRCHASRAGTWTAAFMAQALGVELPSVGETVQAMVSSGVLWRAVGISSLDLRRREARVLLHRLLEEAEMQRAAGAGTDAD